MVEVTLLAWPPYHHFGRRCQHAQPTYLIFQHEAAQLPHAQRHLRKSMRKQVAQVQAEFWILREGLKSLQNSKSREAGMREGPGGEFGGGGRSGTREGGAIG
jgi:hypothetical protein